MNIFAKEIRAGLKSFLLWTLVLFVFVFAGSIKYTGIEAGGQEAMTALLDSFPRIVLAVLGMSGVDITNFGGFYSVLEIYAAIITAIFAVHLGQNAVSRESVDKTYEFLFVKPRSRSFILGTKLIVAVCFLAVFCLLNFAISLGGYKALGLSEDITVTFGFFSLSLFLIGLVFLSLGTLFATLAVRPETGARAGNICVLVCYALGVVYDAVERGGLLQVLTPFKYFSHPLLIEHQFDPLFVALAFGITLVSLLVAFRAFNRRDLTAA